MWKVFIGVKHMHVAPMVWSCRLFTPWAPQCMRVPRTSPRLEEGHLFIGGGIQDS